MPASAQRSGDPFNPAFNRQLVRNQSGIESLFMLSHRLPSVRRPQIPHTQGLIRSFAGKVETMLGIALHLFSIHAQAPMPRSRTKQSIRHSVPMFATRRFDSAQKSICNLR